MRSVIFSLVSGIALTLLLRGPAPPPPAPCVSHAAALQDPGEAIPARVIDALRDTLSAWLAEQDITGAAAVVPRASDPSPGGSGTTQESGRFRSIGAHQIDGRSRHR